MNKEKMMSIIKDIERFFNDLEKEKIKKVDDLKNKRKFYAVSMIMFSIVNRAIDIGEEIVSDKKLGFPGKYREIFHLLEKNKIIDKKLYKEFSDLIHFRNLAAHEYQTFTEKDVFKASKKIGKIKKFVEIVKRTVREDELRKKKKSKVKKVKE